MSRFRFAVDTGGTFTDLIVEDERGHRYMFKAATTPQDPIEGVLNALKAAADGLSLSLRSLLERGSLLIHGTTHALNAVITGRTAKTALIVTAGHRDILVIREGGGRADPFDFATPYPSPYIPRALTFELNERIGVGGEIITPLDPKSLDDIIAQIASANVRSVAVCLLWSPANSIHECIVGERLADGLPDVAVTLSHELNPVLREYRRAISCSIDASLKPLMNSYMTHLEDRLRDAGFSARVLIATSQGGVIDAIGAAREPIRIINSGPSAAPLAGALFAEIDGEMNTAIVADTGGTTYDVSVVRSRNVALARNGRIGDVETGFASVDVTSIGAGGGSLAWVDGGGLLHVGPRSAGALPGPAAYGRGGRHATVTDASMVLGHLDPSFFLGGSMKLDREASIAAVRRDVAEPLGLSVEAAADAILQVVTENMTQAILDITVNQGIDPRSAVLVGGGGAAGLNSIRIARRLNCSRLLIPECGAALSAAGMLMSDLKTSFSAAFPTHSSRFDREGVNRILADLEKRCRDFATTTGADAIESCITFSAEARYAHQVWEIQTTLPFSRFENEGSEAAFIDAFHRTHQQLFGINDPSSAVEVIVWSADVSCSLNTPEDMRLAPSTDLGVVGLRQCWFYETGWTTTKILPFSAVISGHPVVGPAIIESAFTTIVVDPGAIVRRAPSGGLMIEPRDNLVERAPA